MRQHDLYVNAYVRRPEGRSVLFHWTVLAVVFLVTAAVSYALTPATHSSLISQVVGSKGLLGQFKYLLGLAPLELMLAIWVKNMLVALVLLVLGGYLGGLLSYVIVVINAMLLGILSRYLLASGVSWHFILAGLLPHGIIELPAIFLAGAIAIYAVNRRLPFFRRLKGGLGRVAPLLLVAAAVETYITPLVMAHFR